MKRTYLSKMFFLAILPAVMVMSAYKPAGTGYAVGDKVADFNLKNVTGINVSLSGLKDNKGAIVVFTCNHCPFSVAYEDRIIALHKKYASQGFPVVAINPNDAGKVPEDSFEAMKTRAKEKQFPFVYLQDATQEVAKAFGAARTPHVFILSRNGSDYKVEYIGAIDNNTDEPSAATEKYVEKAMDELIAGKKVTTNFTKAIGCTVKWKS
ncbi:MAG TPA: thioredoxin family protein [Bacteroidia bacterium]|nr:thioredoxin family protein [Bacteroidia bacterium]